MAWTDSVRASFSCCTSELHPVSVTYGPSTPPSCANSSSSTLASSVHSPRHSIQLSIPSCLIPVFPSPLLHWCTTTLPPCIISSLIGLGPFHLLVVVVAHSTPRCQSCSISLLRIVITLFLLSDLNLLPFTRWRICHPWTKQCEKL